jgi:hypothetical protein
MARRSHTRAEGSDAAVLARSARIRYAATDATSALIFLWTWIAPGSVFFADVDAMGLVYAVEFASLHAAGMLAMFVLSDRLRPWLRGVGVCGVGALYLAIFVNLGLKAGIWWPAAVLAVLVFGKLQHALFRPPEENKALRFGLQWAGPTALFVLLTGVAFALPWPHLGITPSPDEGRISADGATEAGAHVLVVAGTLYFSVIALLKYRFASYLIAHKVER